MHGISISYNKRESNILLDAILISLVLVLEVCFSAALICILPILFIRCISLFHLNYERKWLADKTTLWLFCMCFITLVSGLRLSDNSEQFSPIYDLVTFICLILVQMILINYKGNFNDILKKIVILTSAIAGIYIFLSEYHEIMSRWQDFLSTSTGYRLGISSGINPNSITWTFGVMALLAIHFFMIEKKASLLLIYGFDIIVIFFTGSKNGLVLAGIPLVIYAIKALRKADLKTIIAIIIFAIIMWYAIHNISFLYTLIGRRIDSMFYTIGFQNESSFASAGMDMGSTEKRIEMIGEAINMYWEKPIFGWGIGAFAKYSGYGYYCHNNFFEILVSGGLILFIIYYSFIFLKAFQIFFMRKGNKKDLAIMLCISVFLLDISTVNFYSNIIFYFRTIMFAGLVDYCRSNG